MKKAKLGFNRLDFKIDKLAARRVSVALIIIFILGAVAAYCRNCMKNCDYFRIKDILPQGAAGPEEFAYLKGRNIFDLDLKKESNRILNSFPDYSEIRLAKILPNRIFVGMNRRRALALVKLYRYFAVDQNGVFFHPAASAGGDPELPVITGLETKIFGPKSGLSYNIKELAASLELIRRMRVNDTLGIFRIIKIDAKNISDISMFIATTTKENKAVIIEVKLDGKSLQDKVSILARLCSQAKAELQNVKYLDLRFREPVIKLKDAQ